MANDVGSPILASIFGQRTIGSARNRWTLNSPVKVSTEGNDTTPAVTEEFVAEITLYVAARITGIALFNGSAVAGNVQCQLYNADGTKVVATASTAQAGVDSMQRIPFTAAQTLAPGQYYIGVQCNNIGARLNTHLFGNGGTTKKTAQTYGTFTALTPPTTFTANVGPMAAFY